ncbi:hypothetical protein HanRHA438_Chr08g0371021 [Helianthus annuus]|nr:hypothetical protein HanIR_Chr08g0387591 [Helianthus annuus]KAJ0899651.1 hypothetical protein HanRHA438_Chr08g0371021 [Helianthus annuus]
MILKLIRVEMKMENAMKAKAEMKIGLCILLQALSSSRRLSYSSFCMNACRKASPIMAILRR